MNIDRQRKNSLEDDAIARTIALKELETAQVDPESTSGREFLARVNAFGIMGVHDPMRSENDDSELIKVG